MKTINGLRGAFGGPGRLKQVILFFFVLLQTPAVWSAERILFIVSELDHRGAPELGPLYRKIEDMSVAIPARIPRLAEIYSKIFYLRDEDVTENGVRRALVEIVSDPQVDSLDMILGVHGRPSILSFYDGPTDVKEWISKIKGDMVQRPQAGGSLDPLVNLKKLGLLYNLSCFGVTHSEDFIDLGFKAVVGSRSVNANAEFEYPWVLAALAQGYSLDEAFRKPNSDSWLRWSDEPLRILGRKLDTFLKDVDSFKEIVGNRKWEMISRAPWARD